jgi:hypothetical protein
MLSGQNVHILPSTLLTVIKTFSGIVFSTFG